MHKVVLCPTPPETVSLEALSETGPCGECRQEALNLIMGDRLHRVDAAVRAHVWENVVTLMQFATNATFKMLDPGAEVSVHVNFRDVLFKYLVDATYSSTGI